MLSPQFQQFQLCMLVLQARHATEQMRNNLKSEYASVFEFLSTIYGSVRLLLVHAGQLAQLACSLYGLPSSGVTASPAECMHHEQDCSRCDLDCSKITKSVASPLALSPTWSPCQHEHFHMNVNVRFDPSRVNAVHHWTH